MKRKHKNYSRPRRPFEKERIEKEGEIKKKFGLKNKKEIWKAEAQVKKIREKAKKLIGADRESQEKFFDSLNKKGIKVNSISDVLALQKEDYLERRLQTVIYKNNLSKTIKGARQEITHKKVLVDGKAINIPGYIVPVELESKIKIKDKKPKKKEVKQEEVTE